MPPTRGPAVPRRKLGTELRRLREEAGLLIDEVASELECSPSKISRLETGKGIPKIRDVRDMLNLYSVTDSRLRERLLQLAREGQQQGWWQEFADVLQSDAPVGSHLEAFVALENDAETVLTFQPNLVHGLLQTYDYARAIIEAVAYRHDPHEIERLVELRLRRQQALSRDVQPIRLHCVLDEDVLWRRVGGSVVMIAQLRKIIQELERPNVTIQVIPFDAGVHGAIVGQFEILKLSDAASHEVVYVESLTGNAILEGYSDILRYHEAFDDVSAKALSAGESAAFLERVLVQYEKMEDVPE